VKRYLPGPSLPDPPDLKVPLWFKIWIAVCIAFSLSILVVVIWALIELVLWVTR